MDLRYKWEEGERGEVGVEGDTGVVTELGHRGRCAKQTVTEIKKA